MYVVIWLILPIVLCCVAYLCDHFCNGFYGRHGVFATTVYIECVNTQLLCTIFSMQTETQPETPQTGFLCHAAHIY